MIQKINKTLEKACVKLFGGEYTWQRIFFICFITAGLLYLPWVILDGGLFHYAGDFNSQQINFYQYSNAFVKNGGTFSWETDLGSGFINSYSFYLVGSPFWWLSLLIPSRAMPYCMVPMLCLKFAVAGTGAFLWARRWVKNSRWAALTALLYTFSGFTIYNVFFNHFVDVVALFPFLLFALDETVLNGRKGLFPVLVALNLLNNYFFFWGQILFLLIYFICQCASKNYKLSAKLFGRLAFESLLGCGMGCLLAWPAVLSLAQNPRTVDLSSGYGFLMYGKVQQYFAILLSFFMMPDAPYMMNLWTEGVIKWTSLTAYLPLVSCVGVLTWLRHKPRTAEKRILCTCLVFALVPALNSAFYAMNSSFYARWYYMPVLVMALCTAKGLEEELPQQWGAGVALAVCAASCALALVPKKNDDDTWSIGVVKDQPKFWLMLFITAAGVAGFWLLWKKRRKLMHFSAVLMAAVLAGTFAYGSVHIAYTKLDQWNVDKNYVQQCYKEGPLLEEYFSQDHFFRIDAFKSYDNIGLWAKTPCIQFFNSTVAPSLLEFYPGVGVKRDVNSKPEQKNYALRGLLSVEYLIVPLTKEEDYLKENVQGWQRIEEVGSYAVYQNENYIPMGFTYDYYVLMDDLEPVTASSRANVLVKAIGLSEEQAGRYGSLLQQLPSTELNGRSYAQYQTDCAERRENACSEFTAEKNGFTAKITLEKENLVFFSVPYDDGFTATVNGQPTQIEKVDGGLVAVLAPAGESKIVFRYHTPGLAQSAAVTGACVVLWGIYLIISHRRGQKEKTTKTEG